jgi:hypothetical protein
MTPILSVQAARPKAWAGAGSDRGESNMLKRPQNGGILARLEGDASTEAARRHLPLVVDLFERAGEVESRGAFRELAQHPQPRPPHPERRS